ncbi:MAG: T9SS type A sorting domain-containing protein [Saprospiraceae bacterium]|nr:T9SS type A sorting domain-containing protein [Saprospiraceae bacterium]
MKRLFTTLILALLIYIVASAQSFNKTAYFFGDSTHTHNEILSIVRIGNNYFFYNGIVDSLNHQWNSVVKTDLYGNLINKKLIGDTSYLISTFPANTIIVDNDSNIIVIGHVKHNSTGYWDAYIAKLNQNLDTLWTKIYDLPDTLAGCLSGEYVLNVLTSVKQTLDGGYIITGKYYINCINVNANERSYLLKLDQDGNVEWRKVYQNVASIFDVNITPDSGYVFPDFMSGYAIAKTDKLGNIEWKRTHNNETHLASGAICLTNNNEIVSFAPYVYSHPDTYTYLYGVHVIEYDLSGIKLWDKEYFIHRSMKCPTIHQSFEIECLPNNSIIINGTAKVINPDSTLGGYKGVMLKLNSNGDSLWSRYYHIGSDFRDDCQFNDLILTNDGGFLAAGYHKPYVGSYNAGAWLVKMDSMGFAPGSYTIGIENNELIITNNVRIYPNPSSDNINLSFAKNPSSQIILQIYNSVGVLVKQNQFQANNQEYRINIEDLESGVYFISILSDNKKLFSDKFIKM